MNQHYYSETQKSKLKLRKIKTTIRGESVEFFTSSGVFAAKKIDVGTKLLAEKMQIKKNDKVLDLGCGSGILGVTAAKLTKNLVYLVDVNERACRIAKLNSKGLKNVKVSQGNMYEPVKKLKFDTILLNPPQTAGKKICFEMIEKSVKHLKKGGTLQLVARHKKGGKPLSQKMLKTFGNIKIVAKRGGYRVYVSKLS